MQPIFIPAGVQVKQSASHQQIELDRLKSKCGKSLHILYIGQPWIVMRGKESVSVIFKCEGRVIVVYPPLI